MDSSTAISGMGVVLAEAARAQLGDKRRTKRLVRVLEAVAAGPDRTIPDLCAKESETEALYRLLGNRDFSFTDILAPHFDGTAERCAAYTEVLAVQDSSVFSYSGESQRRGLGPTGHGGQGFKGHFALAVSNDGVRRPLGLLDVTLHVRPREDACAAGEEDREEEEPEAEFARWRETAGAARARVAGRARVIHLMDREADDYELLYDLISSGDGFVIRVKHNRRVVAEKVEGGYPYTRLEGRVLAATVLAEREVPVSGRGAGKRGRKTTMASRDRRSASLSVSATRVKVLRPRGVSTDLPGHLEVNVVRVWEPNPPEGEEPVEWRLYTSEPVDTEAPALRVVDLYRARWVIEEYFKVLKTGCAMEDRQLESFETLSKMLALLAQIAWQLLLLRTLARDEPNVPAPVVFTRERIAIVRAEAARPLPENPTVRDIYWALAGMGGHLAHNGEPGWLVLWRGFEKLIWMEYGWRLATRTGKCDQS